MKCSIQFGFTSLNRTFSLSPHENIHTIALVTIHYLYTILDAGEWGCRLNGLCGALTQSVTRGSGDSPAHRQRLHAQEGISESGRIAQKPRPSPERSVCLASNM